MRSLTGVSGRPEANGKAAPVATGSKIGATRGKHPPDAVPFLRYMFPRHQSRYGRAMAERHARELAARWLSVPARDRFPSRLEAEAQRYGVESLAGYSNFEVPAREARSRAG